VQLGRARADSAQKRAQVLDAAQMSDEGGYSSEKQGWMQLGRAKVDGPQKSDKVWMELKERRGVDAA